jgi:uncharacterized protein (TIGR04255 family)
MRIPAKLKKDAIVEAICEIRFRSNDLDELVLGRLGDDDRWGSYAKIRLPIADLPGPVRNADPNLKFQPLLQFSEASTNTIVKIGASVFSFHVLKPYCGWSQFKPQLYTLFDFLFSRLKGVVVERIGLRYINGLTREDHLVENIDSLNVEIKVGGDPLKLPYNLNYMTTGDKVCALVRIASPEFVSGTAIPGLTALIDVDVFTPTTFTASESGAIKQWLEVGHSAEKTEFFRLLPPAVLDALVEEW